VSRPDSGSRGHGRSPASCSDYEWRGVLAVEVDPARIKRRIETGYCQVLSNDLDEALAKCIKAKQNDGALSVGLVGNAATVYPEILRRGIVPKVVTEQTSVQPRTPPLKRLESSWLQRHPGQNHRLASSVHDPLDP
jgi:urocanate hydratase